MIALIIFWESIDPVKLGLLLSYIIWIQWILLWLTDCVISLDKLIVSFERIQKIIEVKTENFG